MQVDSGIRLHALRVDGGAVANNFLGCSSVSSQISHAWNARSARSDRAGRRLSGWSGRRLPAEPTSCRKKKPSLSENSAPALKTTERNYRYSGWKKAVKRAMAWEDHDK